MQTGIIYTLTDPRDDRIRYVGKTTKTAADRLAGHLASPTNPAMRVWIHALALQGLTPRITPIAKPPVDRLSVEEEKQIAAHHRAGHRIFNAPYYHRNLADLCLPPKATAAARVSDDPPMNKIDQHAHNVYGPLAAAKAAGRASGGRTAVEVLLRAPVLAFLIAWSTFNVRAVRLVLLTLFWGCGLWTVGFDHLVRDKVVPHLPIDQTLGFWNEYLEHPLTNLGWLLLASHLGLALLMYTQVAEAARAEAPKSPAAGQAPKSVLSSAEIAAAAAAALDGALPKQSGTSSSR
ncbi:hypothetical protein ACK8N7_26440 [Streptomyces griseobrunneus]